MTETETIARQIADAIDFAEIINFDAIADFFETYADEREMTEPIANIILDAIARYDAKHIDDAELLPELIDMIRNNTHLTLEDR